MAFSMQGTRERPSSSSAWRSNCVWPSWYRSTNHNCCHHQMVQPDRNTRNPLVVVNSWCFGRWSPFSIGKKSKHNSNWQALNFWIAGFPSMGEVKFHLLFRDAGYSFSERSSTLFTIIMLLTKNILKTNYLDIHEFYSWVNLQYL